MSKPNRTQIAQRYLEGYLRIAGVKDPQASIQSGGASIPIGGFSDEYILDPYITGVRGPDRATVDGRVNYVLPEPVIAEINREFAGLPPFNQRLVDTLNAAVDGGSLDGTIAACLRKHYESANAHAPGEGPKPSYWDNLRAYWETLKVDKPALQPAN